MGDLSESHILINKGDIIHDSRDSISKIDQGLLKIILPYVYSYLIDNQPEPENPIEYSEINKDSHKIVKLILLNQDFGTQNRYKYTDLKNINIVSDLQPVLYKKDIFSILPSDITNTFNDNVNPAKYINSKDLKIIDTPATYIDPASRENVTKFFIPLEEKIDININKGSYNQNIKVNFISKFNNEVLTVKIELTHERLRKKKGGKQPLLSCMVNKDGEITSFLSDNNVPQIQYFSGNRIKNEYIQKNYKNGDIKNKLTPGSDELNEVLLLFVCKELGDTMQSLILKYFYEKYPQHKINESTSCLFTSDTWCAARARLNRVPVLLRNADRTLSFYSPLSEKMFIRLIITTNVQNVIKNNRKILQILENVILSFTVKTSGTAIRRKIIYSKLKFETTKTNIDIEYNENIRNLFIKIYIFIYFSIYICELISEQNKTITLDLDIIKNILSFLKATTPILSYNNSDKYIYLNGLIRSIFNIKLYKNGKTQISEIDYLIAIIYEYSKSNNISILPEYYDMQISEKNTIGEFIEDIQVKLDDIKFTENDIIYKEGFGNYLNKLPKLSQNGGMLKRYRTPEKERSPGPDVNTRENSKKKGKLELRGVMNTEKGEKKGESDSSDRMDIDTPEPRQENDFLDEITDEKEVSLELPKFDSHNITTYSIYSILYNYLLEYPSLYTHFEKNLSDIITKILAHEDFITVDKCSELNQEYEEKTLDKNLDNSDNSQDNENYRDDIVKIFLHNINNVLIELIPVTGGNNKQKNNKRTNKKKIKRRTVRKNTIRKKENKKSKKLKKKKKTRRKR